MSAATNESTPTESAGSEDEVVDVDDVDTDCMSQLRTAVADLLADGQIQSDDLNRWLAARNADVPKAEKMLRDSLVWRKQIGADQLTDDDYDAPEVLRKYFPVGLVGHDKVGRPVWIVPFGRCDLKGLMQSAKKSDYVKYCVHLMERSMRDIKTQSKSLAPDLRCVVDRHVVIVDLDQFGMRQATWTPGVDLIVHVSKVFSDNYPETLENIYVVNTPKIFEVAYAVLKKFINETTICKIRVFGREHWQEALLQNVDASELPVQWGGTKADDPTLVRCGGDVPQSYYMAPANRLCEALNVQHAVVAKGSKLWIERDVEAADAVLKWEFKTEANDIGFSVYIRRRPATTDSGNDHDVADMEELLPKQRVNCHLVPEDGSLVCTEPGKYVLCFDNSFSRLRSKKLSYVVDVTPGHAAAAADKEEGSAATSDEKFLRDGENHFRS